MGTTSEELKKLYTKLGGSEEHIANASTPGEIINAINELDLSVQYELPGVTSEDNGKVLGVVEGHWNKAEQKKELPGVTSEDNGKVLGVVEGEWGKANPAKSVPDVTAEDNGRVLKVIDGDWNKGTITKSDVGLSNVDDTSDMDKPISTATGEAIAVVDYKIEKLRREVEGVILYGFHIDGGESNPSSRVTYLEDCVGYVPAHMNFTSGEFDYGSWSNAFFMPKPCILGQDGTVIKYLNPDDYTKDVDGNSVVIDNTLVGANVMMEWPKIWRKVVPSSDHYSADIYIANKKIDDDFKDWAYISMDGTHKEHFYTPCYVGSWVDNVLRSVSGNNATVSKTFSQYVDSATENGSGWYIETLADVDLINFLLILIGKSTNTQTVFGTGVVNSGTYYTGDCNDKGLFWGNNDRTSHVKVFGMEDWWGWKKRRVAGYAYSSKANKIKMCFGTEDGSTVNSYLTDNTSNGYISNHGRNIPSGSFIKNMYFGLTMIPTSGSGGSSSTYYCDNCFDYQSSTTYASRGGYNNGTSLDGPGAFHYDLILSAFDTDALYGAALTYR